MACCITQTVGRILFVTLLISSAYLHLQKPETFAEQFSSNYQKVTECIQKHGGISLKEASTINWLLWVKVYGAFQGLMALLIVFGDCLGATLLALTMIIQGVVLHSCTICNFAQWTSCEQCKFAQCLGLFGITLTLLACNKAKKNC